MKPLSPILAGLLLCATQAALGGDCRKAGSVCIDTTPSKQVSGATVTIDQVGGCWQYQDTYECVAPNTVDYCSALQSTPGCAQTSSACTQYAFDGSCMTETRSYQCNDASMAAPANTVKLDSSYTIFEDQLDTSQCDSAAGNPYCTLASEQCTEGPETRIINGLAVYKDCWQYQRDYSCVDPNPVNDCQPLIDKGCTQVARDCIATDDQLGCVASTLQYSCMTRPGTTRTVQDCSDRTACFNGTCWDNSAPPDGDFAMAVAGQEVAREAGVYGTDGTNLFRGVEESCTKGYGGLRNCCRPGTGAQTNNNMLMGIGMQAVPAIGAEALNVGSKYVYDFMYPSGPFSADGLSCINTAFQPTSLSSTLSFYGFGYNFGGEAAVSDMTGLGGDAVTSLGSGFYFDPYSFAIAVALTVVADMTACDPSEQVLGQHMGANLVHFVGSYCSQKVLGVCVLTKQAYCSFNSRLALILNEQGRPLIGKSWGSAQTPDCSGFSVSEFQGIDFSKIDLSSFTNEILDSTALPSSTAVGSKLGGSLQGITSNIGRPLPSERGRTGM
jgi:conjugal transfer mating pair stabilization protein TraN